MNIDKITVSTQEVCQALTLWFKQVHEHSFEVENVNKRYSFDSEWEVTLVDPNKKETALGKQEVQKDFDTPEEAKGFDTEGLEAIAITSVETLKD